MSVTISICMGALVAAVLLGLFRLGRGPTVLDRILAFDLITTGIVGMVVVLSVFRRTPVYLELILIFALLGFLSAVAFVIHLHRSGKPRRQPDLKAQGSAAGEARGQTPSS